MIKLLTKEEIHQFFSILKKENPEPVGELDYTNTYTLLVAVALSAQATDKGVNKATKSLFEIVSTPEDMVALGHDGLIEHIKTIGLYNSKAKNVMAAAKMLIKDFGSQVPQDRDSLVKLPGVGRKTANVVLNIAFGQPTIAVDTHLFRLSNRTGLARGKTPDAVEKHLEKRIPKEFLRDSHHWMILHGRYVCKARKPECEACAVYKLCNFDEKTA